LVAITTQKNGITVATVANKLSMIIPVTTAFYLYPNESVNAVKVVGIVLALIAVVFTSVKNNNEKSAANYKYLLLPFGLWFLGGCVDTVIGYVETTKLQPETFPIFLIVVFGVACIIGTTWLGIKMLRGNEKISFKNILGGIALGVPNFFSLFFFLKALNGSGLDKSVIFPVSSVGVVVLSTLGAYFIFSEQLSKRNVLGIALALMAIVLINL